MNVILYNKEFENHLTQLDNFKTISITNKENPFLIMSNLKDCNELHLLAHGSPGHLDLGIGIDTKALYENAEYLASLNVQKIILWGCHVGKDIEFIKTFSKLVNATVYVSKDYLGKNKGMSDGEFPLMNDFVKSLPFYLIESEPESEPEQEILSLTCVTVKYKNLEGGFYHLNNFIPTNNQKWRDRVGQVVTIQYTILSDQVNIYQWGQMINVLEWSLCFDISLFNSKRKQWKSLNISNYSFDFRWICFCIPDYLEPVNISVKNGVISQIISIKESKVIQGNQASFFKTIDGLFDYIQDMIECNAYRITIDYHDHIGFPLEGDVDKNKLVVEDEESFIVSNFQIQYHTKIQLGICDPPYKDSYNLNKMEIASKHAPHMLLLNVSYSGGCMKHEFQLCWDGTMINSIPPQISVLLSHNSNMICVMPILPKIYTLIYPF